MNSKKLILLVFLAVSTISLQAQTDFDDAIQGSVTDANYILEGYATPFMKVIGYGLNQGWYNTAANHKDSVLRTKSDFSNFVLRRLYVSL